MIIDKEKFAEYVCPLRMVGSTTGNCLGPKCLAFEEVGSVPDRAQELNRAYDKSPGGREWFFVQVERDSGEKNYWATYHMIERATCGMIPKEEVSLIS